jgi:acyl-CoA thioester hydrolase
VRHTYHVVVRWSDEDRLGHINNSRYLTYTEDARLGWLSQSPQGNGGVILARAEVDFRRPVHFVAGGHLAVHSWVQSVGTSSVRLHQDIVDDDDQTVAAVLSVIVGYDYDGERSRPWADDERAWLARWTPDEAAG